MIEKIKNQLKNIITKKWPTDNDRKSKKSTEKYHNEKMADRQ